MNIDSLLEKYVLDDDNNTFKMKIKLLYKSNNTKIKGNEHDYFQNWLCNSELYINYVKNILKNAYHKKLNVELTCKELDMAFSRLTATGLDTIHNLDKFVCESDIFKKNTLTYIKSIAYTDYNVKITDIQCNDIIEKIDTLCNFNDLHKNIHIGIKQVFQIPESHSTTKDTSVIELSNWVKHKLSFENKDNIYEVTRIINKMNDRDYVFNMIKSADENTLSFHSISKIEQDFYAVFNRSITIFEYVKYAHSYNNTIDFFIDLKGQYVDIFNIGKNLYKNFLNIELDETKFIKEFCQYFDKANISEYIVDNIINTSSYDSVMKDKINTLYHDSYKEDMYIHDLTHVFEKIKSNKLALTSQLITKIIYDEKKITDEYILHFDSIFESILQRKMDREEKDEIIQNVRKNNDINVVSFSTTESLYKSLEYNEILKNEIINTLKSIKTDISNSKVFKILKSVLEQDDEQIKRNKDGALRDYIIQFK